MQSHHPSIISLTEFAAGGTRLSHGLCIAAHLEHCASCRQKVAKLNQVGAELFEGGASASLQQEDLQLKDHVFAMLDDDEFVDDIAQVKGAMEVVGAVTESSATTTSVNDRVPSCLRQFVKAGYGELEWSRISPSIKVATLCRDSDGSQVALSCVQAGGKMPHHRHTGDEITVVLEGSFSDEDGIYHQGSYIKRDPKDKHTPVVSKDGECICLMTVDSPIEFTGFWTRLLNPIVRKNHYK